MTVPTFVHLFFFFNDTATTEIYTLSLHDALPILKRSSGRPNKSDCCCRRWSTLSRRCPMPPARQSVDWSRSEEHTSELQSESNLVCRLLLEKKKKAVLDRHGARLVDHYIIPHYHE